MELTIHKDSGAVQILTAQARREKVESDQTENVSK